MNCGDATEYALWAFKVYKLGKRWKFAIGGSKNEYGSCDFKTKTIEVSKVLLKKSTLAEAEDTILHEIAHALRGNHLHDKKWKEIAEKVGALPSAQKSYEGEKVHKTARMAKARKRVRRGLRWMRT